MPSEEDIDSPVKLEQGLSCRVKSGTSSIKIRLFDNNVTKKGSKKGKGVRSFKK